jgi:hypothetical protein
MGIIRGEPVVLAAKDESRAEALAHELGPLARAASVQDAIGGADVVAFEAWLTRPPGRPCAPRNRGLLLDPAS